MKGSQMRTPMSRVRGLGANQRSALENEFGSDI